MTTCRLRISTQGIDIIRAEPDVEICFCLCDRRCWIPVSPPCLSLVLWVALSDSTLYPDGFTHPSLWPAALGHLLIGQSCCLAYDWQVSFPNSRFCSTYCPMPAVLGRFPIGQSCYLKYDWQVPFPAGFVVSTFYCWYLTPWLIVLFWKFWCRPHYWLRYE